MRSNKKRGNGNAGIHSIFSRNPAEPLISATNLLSFDNDLWEEEIGTKVPPANISETMEEFVIDLSVPGLNKEDFIVEAEGGVLNVTVEKKEETEHEKKNYKKREFSYNSFRRSFDLPDNADDENIKAKYDNGILRITVPKKQFTISKPVKNIKIS